MKVAVQDHLICTWRDMRKFGGDVVDMFVDRCCVGWGVTISPFTYLPHIYPLYLASLEGWRDDTSYNAYVFAILLFAKRYQKLLWS
jgi:hypothetical protein